MRKQWESGGYDRGVMLVLRQQPRETSKSGHWPGSPSVGMGTASRPSDFLTWQRSRSKTDHFMKDCFLRILFDSKQRESLNFFSKEKEHRSEWTRPHLVTEREAASGGRF